ncbi:MAG: rhomboid family intramembrane serine protease [Planctomycetia bacterium]|jgi:membrane associated rhomboid family serine protease
MFPFHCDNPTYRTAFITWAIIGINVAMFIGYLRMSPSHREMAVITRGFIPARVVQSLKGEPVTIPKQVIINHPVLGPRPGILDIKLSPNRGKVLLSVFTSMFMHASWMHLIGNMWFLALFGPKLEDRLGPIPFLLFYLLGGFIAAACHWAIDPSSLTSVIGASGAVAAVLGGYAIAWPWVRVQTLVFLVIFITVIDVPALFVLGAWFLIQLAEAHYQLGLNTAGGVAWWAHIGGFLAGMGMMPLLCLVIKEKKPPVEDEEENETYEEG